MFNDNGSFLLAHSSSSSYFFAWFMCLFLFVFGDIFRSSDPLSLNMLIPFGRTLRRVVIGGY